jgi:hypothetical protein
MIRSRSLVLAAVVVVVGLTACGDPNVTPPLARQPKVIELASSQPSGAAGAAPAVASANSADRKMAVFAPTEFVFEGDLPSLDGSAASWYFAADGQPDLQRIAKLASSLGVKGDVRSVAADQGGGWAVGPQDYSGPVLTVNADAQLTWSFSSGSTTSIGYACASPGIAIAPSAGSGGSDSSGGAVDTLAPVAPPAATTPDASAPPVDVVAPDCPQPQPPAGVPSKGEALASAKQLFADLGYDLTSYEFDDPYADQWSASVNASRTLDGMKAPIVLSVQYGENGSITWASGSLAEPQRGADYPTVGAAAGLERLKTQRYAYGTTGGPMTKAIGAVAPQPAVVAPQPAVVGPQPALGAPAIAPGIAPCEAGPATDCAPINVEPITVTLNSVKPGLTMVWGADNTIWVLPAYTFGSADGGIYTVIAVDDAYIQQPGPAVATTEVPIVEPAQVEPNVTSIAPIAPPAETVPTP